jgi:hypothetical protein
VSGVYQLQKVHIIRAVITRDVSYGIVIHTSFRLVTTFVTYNTCTPERCTYACRIRDTYLTVYHVIHEQFNTFPGKGSSPPLTEPQTKKLKYYYQANVSPLVIYGKGLSEYAYRILRTLRRMKYLWKCVYT